MVKFLAPLLKITKINYAHAVSLVKNHRSLLAFKFLKKKGKLGLRLGLVEIDRILGPG